jgi:Reverse transcriptase (RNA-dependent DNA polymerase)
MLQVTIYYIWITSIRPRLLNLLAMALIGFFLAFYDWEPLPTTYIPKRKRARNGLLMQYLLRLSTKMKVVTAIANVFTVWLQRMWSNHQVKTVIQRRHKLARRFMAPPTKFKLRKSNYVYPMMAMTSIIVHSATSSDGIPFKAGFDTDSVYFGIDNRCSACISNVRDHFVGDLVPTRRTIKAYGGSKSYDVHHGTMRLRIEDDDGKVTTFDIPDSYFIPDGDSRLLSPQHWARSLKKSLRPLEAPESTYHDRIVLRWGTIHPSVKTVPLDPITNVATFSIAPGFRQFDLYCAQANIDLEAEQSNPMVIHASAIIEEESKDTEIPTTSPEYNTPAPKETSFNLNGPISGPAPVLTEDEEDQQTTTVSAEFLKYHQKFNHCSPRRLQMLAKSGVIPRRLATCPVPVCSACLYGKATRRPWRVKAQNKPSSVPTLPGQVVSVDQMVSKTPGLIAQMSGFLTKERYRYATVFVDNATDYSYVHFHKSSSAEEALEAKETFERKASEFGVKIRHYHADNGVFATHLWRSHCIARGQGLTFAAAGAHHQNGKAEAKIRHLQSQARTMLIHAQHRWPQAVTANLWPYAIRMANETSLELPSLNFKDNRTPLQAFTGSTTATNPRFWQPFGCPTYVLESELQNPQSAIRNKWKDRSRIGLYLGRSPLHARSVALVLNLQTGRVSPQFHVSFDPYFQTVKQSYNGLPVIVSWLAKAGFTSEQPDNSTPVPIDTRQLSQTNSLAPANLSPLSENQLLQRELQRGTSGKIQSSHQYFDVEEIPPMSDQLPSTNYVSTDTSGPPKTVLKPPTQSEYPTTRSGRHIRPVERLMYASLAVIGSQSITDQPITGELFCMTTLCSESYQDSELHPLELSTVYAMAVSNDPDTLTYQEAMRAPDKESFLKSMSEEIASQMEMGAYELVPRSSKPPGTTLLPAVWAMRRKRKSTTGEVHRHKARLNLGGHRMVKGRDYDQTYAPVAAWPSIRLLLGMTLQNNWHTRQVDYVLAFPQAPIDRDIYMEVPRGCIVPGHNPKDFLLKIKRNVYGGKASGRIWYQHLRKKLDSIGFRVSEHDECVFFKGNAMYVLYTDDSILAGPDPNELDAILLEMKHIGLDITSEGGIDDFLGVSIEHKPDGTFHLTQQRLINSILEDLGLLGDNVVTKSTPMASSKLLSRHPTSPAFDGHFNYRRVIGKLMYLEKSTRPDLAYAVHQCARFSHEPKEEHGKAVKWIGRYLKATADKGLIIHPSSTSLDLYVDSDFAGNWDPEIADNDSSTANSRHGYVLKYCGMPILWASQLQSICALSSTEAEYVALSRSVQDSLLCIRLLQEMKGIGFNVPTNLTHVHCKIFEDNIGAIEIATIPKYRPRTKHINNRYHFFRSLISDPSQSDPDKPLSIHKIDTSAQLADILTKPLPHASFTRHRLSIMGW